MRRKYFQRWLRRLTPFVFACTGLTACGDSEIVSPSLRPGWVLNQQFHLETSYNLGAGRTERGNPASLDSIETAFAAAEVGDPVDLDESAELGDRWSDPVIWRYQVIRQGFVPAGESDDFWEFYVKGGKESPLTVIKASLDPSMNLGSEIEDADPKIYMVVRDDRLRMAGLVYFWTDGSGERVRESMTVEDGDMNRSYSLLSQSNLALIPHFVPPFPIAAENRDLELEDGQLVTFTNANEAGVDVVYENALDNTLIAERWEEGQPWAVRTETPTISSRLMDPSEIDDLGFDEGDDPEDADYIDLLKQAINLNDALYVTDMVGDHTHEVQSRFRPWSGSWWRQSEGALIFGTAGGGSTRDTISDVRRAAFETPARNVQNLGEEIRNLSRAGNRESAEYTAKTAEYKAEQEKLVKEMVDFYNAVRSAIDGGRIRMENRGTNGNPEFWIVANANWNQGAGEAPQYEAFDFKVDTLSPLDKFALLQHVNGRFYGSNPWFAGAWEALNHWSPAGSGWWGHCNGWSAAAILANEPRAAHEVGARYVANVAYNTENGLGARDFDLTFSVADMKGLLSETYYSQLSSFYGERYNGDEGEDISDLSPKAVLHILSTYIGQRGVPLVFDTTAGDQVWNYPAFKYRLNLTETTVGGNGSSTGGTQVNVNLAGLEELQTLWGITAWRAERIVAYREANGPFQAVADLKKVRGIGQGILNRNEGKISVSVSDTPRTFDGALTVWTKNDGVGYEHLDEEREGGNGADILSFQWNFTLETSPAGEIISGAWDDNQNGHPDFAWVPYTNTAQSGRSENGFLYFPDLKTYLPADMIRE